MIKSMTAFAREGQGIDAGDLTWEIRSVNHRFLEPHLRLPEELRGLDPAIRKRLNEALNRGKIDCALRFTPKAGVDGKLEIDHRLLEQLLVAADQIATRIGEPATPHVIDLMRWPGLLQEPPSDVDQIGAAALSLLDRTLEALVAVRAGEGERLRALLLDRCDRLEALVQQVRTRMPEVIEGVRTRLRERLAEVSEQLDAERLEQEMTLLAQRLDVDEEMDRLQVHLGEVRKALDSDAPVGRRLDFLMQELNREANTLGSKSSDSAVTLVAVDMKVLIEQMREQVQNVE